MQLRFDMAANALVLTPDEPDRADAIRHAQLQGVIDVAENGRLAGIELSLVGEPAPERALRDWRAGVGGASTIDIDGFSVYITLTTGDDRELRSAAATLIGAFSGDGALLAITIPRRGVGYEITYPSGNR